MIDPHVHLRDWKQEHKETVLHGLNTAYRAGLDAVFEMPNTDLPLTSRDTLVNRRLLADEAIRRLKLNIFHGMYAGITADPTQIAAVVEAHDDFFPRVVGLKMFAGQSTGNMGVIEESQQQLVYETLAGLGYKGVLVVHCEKESLMRSDLWNLEVPYSHALARPPEAEAESVKDQIRFAQKAGYKGTLHIAHISTPDAFYALDMARYTSDFTITCEITPHHAMLNTDMMTRERGHTLKMNPPLRPKHMQEHMLKLLLDGKITYIATDHAPHTIKEKQSNKSPSGIPGLPYYPAFLQYLHSKGMSEEELNTYAHDNILKTFNIPKSTIPNTCRALEVSKKELRALANEYDFNAFECLGYI